MLVRKVPYLGSAAGIYSGKLRNRIRHLNSCYNNAQEFHSRKQVIYPWGLLKSSVTIASSSTLLAKYSSNSSRHNTHNNENHNIHNRNFNNYTNNIDNNSSLSFFAGSMRGSGAHKNKSPAGLQLRRLSSNNSLFQWSSREKHYNLHHIHRDSWLDRDRHIMLVLRGFSTSKQESGAPKTDEELQLLKDGEEIKADKDVEDPRLAKNSPEHVSGVIEKYLGKLVAFVKSIPSVTGSMIKYLIDGTVNWFLPYLWKIIKDPKLFRADWEWFKGVCKHEWEHYKTGSKLLWADMKTSYEIMKVVVSGKPLTRRQRRQLLLTTSDMFRLIPLTFFLIVPFAELALPFCLKIWPNMLPSTFQDKLQKEETMKRELKLRLAFANFLAETVTEMSKTRTDGTAKELADFIKQCQSGEELSSANIVKYAAAFKDELTLDNASRTQLVSMCTYMDIPPYGNSLLLRTLLKTKMRMLKEDDIRILSEGVDVLTLSELREACMTRGMRGYGLSQIQYRKQLTQWLDLSVQKQVPISLLVLSRALTIDGKYHSPTAAIVDSVKQLEPSVVNEAIIQSASPKEAMSKEIQAIKLTAIENQNEMIKEENAEAQKLEKRKKELKEKELKIEEAVKKLDIEKAFIIPTIEDDAAKVQKAAQEMSKAMTPSADFASAHNKTLNPLEKLPTEKVLTEAEIVSGSGSDKLTSNSSNTSTQGLAPVSSAVSSATPMLISAANAIASASAALTVAAARETDKTSAGTGSVSSPEIVHQPLVSSPSSSTEVKIKDLNALSDMLSTSAVTSEKEELDRLRADLKSNAIAVVEAVTAIGGGDVLLKNLGLDISKLDNAAPGSKPQVEDESIIQMKKQLESLLDKLDDKIQEVDTKIGNKLQLLDLDQDGILSTDELKEVMVNFFKETKTPEEAAMLAASLDVDNDGFLSIDELKEYIRKRQDEENAHLQSESSPVPPSPPVTSAVHSVDIQKSPGSGTTEISDRTKTKASPESGTVEKK